MLVEKVCFFKKMLVLNPYPQTPFPRKGAILLGLPPLDPVGGFAPATPFFNKQEVFCFYKAARLSGGFNRIYLLIIFSAAEARYNEPVIIAISFVPALSVACDIALSRSAHDVQRTPCSIAKRVS